VRVVTWNVNSLRLRLDLVERLVAELRPDLLCLQEIKVTDELFPLESCRALGFDHVAFHGMKGYNGVALLSRRPLLNIRSHSWCGKDDRRHLGAELEDGTAVHCLYVPAGGDIPDPDTNPKFAHKLDFLRALTEWAAAELRPDAPAILAGDFNIAPLENDVWSHKQLLDVVSHTPVEVEALTRLQATVPLIDAVRHFVPETEKLYTWWSYRSPDWTRNDRGRRLDHIWVTPALRDRLRGALVAREARAWPQPSDHVPVLVDLDL
jgi:exodeoxyribonuclease-3